MTEPLGKYMTVEEHPPRGTHVTSVWIVRNARSQNPLGEVRWYTAWRQYVFIPNVHTGPLFNARCLFDLLGFLGNANAKHKAARKKDSGGAGER